MVTYSNFKCPSFGNAICINPAHVESVVFAKRFPNDARRKDACTVFLASGNSHRVEGLLADVVANLEAAK